MKKTYKVKSSAKINIGLRVLSKRKDGYHNIETIFYPIKLYDIIRVIIEPLKNTSKITVTTDSESNLNNKNNICYKAVGLFLKEFKIKQNYEIKINIDKKIPIGAGLGGGSSNAAAVLKILAKHFKKLNQTKRLNKIALSLGSDVPFFLLNKSTYATSRGEKLKSLPKFKVKQKILLVYPHIHISTSWAYKELEVQKEKPKIFNKVITFEKNKDILLNEFEKPVFKKYPKIKSIKNKMKELGAMYSLISGSGSTVYGFFSSGTKLNRAKVFFLKKNYSEFIP